MKQQNKLSLILAQRMSKYKKIINNREPRTIFKAHPFGIVESSYYKDQWLGYDRYIFGTKCFYSLVDAMEFSKIDLKFIRHRHKYAVPGIPNLSNIRYFSSILNNFYWQPPFCC